MMESLHTVEVIQEHRTRSTETSHEEPATRGRVILCNFELIPAECVCWK
jgi:hypothetical protein